MKVGMRRIITASTSTSSSLAVNLATLPRGAANPGRGQSRFTRAFISLCYGFTCGTVMGRAALYPQFLNGIGPASSR